MSYLNCRTDEYYNQKYLDKNDKSFLDGFDWAMENAVDNFFDNNFGDEDCDDSYISHIMKEEVPKYMKEDYEMEFSFGDRPVEERTVQTYADYVRMLILEWIEIERNELITSMIDGYDEEKYDRIKAEVDGKGQSEKEN